MNKNAFTLAEVLITLGIIGVVAALTLPTLISNHKRKTVAVKVKKAYSELYQAIRLSEAQNGEMTDWKYNFDTNSTENTKQFVENYINPFYPLTYCSTGSDDVCGKAVSSRGVNYTSKNGTGISFVIFYGATNISVLVDTNGNGKPNIMGTDYFYFNLENGKVLPNSWYDGITREGILNGYSDPDGYPISCKKTSGIEDDPSIYTLRHGCTALLMLDGWEFKDDYPY